MYKDGRGFSLKAQIKEEPEEQHHLVFYHSKIRYLKETFSSAIRQLLTAIPQLKVHYVRRLDFGNSSTQL